MAKTSQKQFFNKQVLNCCISIIVYIGKIEYTKRMFNINNFQDLSISASKVEFISKAFDSCKSPFNWKNNICVYACVKT